MYMNVFYPGSEVWLSHDPSDTGWHFIWLFTFNYLDYLFYDFCCRFNLS
jgi:hypothetical protein